MPAPRAGAAVAHGDVRLHPRQPDPERERRRPLEHRRRPGGRREGEGEHGDGGDPRGGEGGGDRHMVPRPSPAAVRLGRMKLRCALAAAFVLAALPASAAVAAPITLGPGVQPAVTVDPSSGTAYIAWIGNEPGTTSLHLCRLPRGAVSCDLNVPVTVPGTSLTRPYVTVD